ncbi:unnamed protein product [Periconia digitata]|uniref:Kelch repeat-containing protein n=1 Tax=Periconia digitata TaxID=1303443 RepID=A0A9W4XQG2_9PLEO|nr:unnamed protein product [Periconia digitata]
MLFPLIILWFLGTVTLAIETDPLKGFCRLHGHQTAVVDRKFYIDGGLVNWTPLSAESTNYTSTWLREADFDNLHEAFPEHSLLTKDETVPSVQGGVLWPDESNKLVYQYGGEYGNSRPEEFKLRFYDIVYKTWNVSNATTTNIQRSAWGAGATAQDKGMSFYYGGYLTAASVPGYPTTTVLSNMIIYNMNDNSFRNQSGPDNNPRAEGSMVYIPAGDGGMLVYFGGVEFVNGNLIGQPMPMNMIRIYDIANNLWFMQNATGDEIPGNRRRFCAGAAWAEDRSSYNIYLYGGASVGDGTGYGDVWILSLPSFTWIKFYPDNEYPHHSLSCTVFENTQMIVMGGHFPNQTSNCDVPTIYGQHNLHFGKTDKDEVWGDFKPGKKGYRIPPEIYKKIGGSEKGGATLQEPPVGWMHRDLKTQFSRAHTQTDRPPTRDINPPPPPAASTETPAPTPEDNDNTKVIGGAVGGAVGGVLVIAAVGVFFLLRRRKQRAQAAHPNQSSRAMPPPSEMDSPVSSKAGLVHSPPGSPPLRDSKWGYTAPDSNTQHNHPYQQQRQHQHQHQNQHQHPQGGYPISPEQQSALSPPWSSHATPFELAGPNVSELAASRSVERFELPGHMSEDEDAPGNRGSRRGTGHNFPRSEKKKR